MRGPGGPSHAGTGRGGAGCTRPSGCGPLCRTRPPLLMVQRCGSQRRDKEDSTSSIVSGHEVPSETGGAGGRPPRLQVRLLGGAEVVLDGRRLRAFNALRLLRFLARIAIRGDPQHRSRLAFELWPDSTERQARTNLRKLIHDLRRSLTDVDQFVEIDREIVRWIPSGPSEIDVLKFREARAVGDLELAARLYSGDLLPASYEDWVLSERAKLRDEAFDTFSTLAEEATRAGEHRASIRHAQRMTELRPLDEAGTRIQMEACLALDDRAGALRAYHRFAEAFERDLGMPPGEAIRDMYRRVRVGGVDAGHEREADPPPVGDSPFVGRDVELAQLADLWASARSGGAHFVLLSGEPGIGKSRLAAELGKRVRAEGHGVASARAYEAAGRLSWGPVVDLLRSDALMNHVDSLDPVWRAELGRLLPELVDDPELPEPGRSGDPAQRHRLFDAVNRAVTVGSHPRLLIIDDLQWCDVETIELIGFVVRSGPSQPLLIIGTLRPQEIQDDHPIEGLVEALKRDQAVTTIPLERLDEVAMAALAAQLGLQDDVDERLAARLWRETDGNPLFVIEALRAGFSSGTQAVLTPTMRTVLSARLDQLPDGARRLAEVAAVIGRSFTAGLIVSAAGVDEREAVEDLDELWRRRIILDRGHSYDFSHDTLRAVALERIGPARRRQLHRAVAEAIRLESRSDAVAASPRLAAHYDRAGMFRPAIEAYRTAGARAVEVSALVEAVTLLRRALSLLADLPSSPERDKLELEIRVALGSPLVAVEGYGSKTSHQNYERARSLCRRLRRPVDPPVLRGLGLARLQGCRFDDSSELGQALLDHESQDPVARTEGQYLLGVSGFWRGDLPATRHHLDAALECYDAARRDEHLALYAQDPWAVCLVRRAWAELWSGDPGQADRMVREALEGTIDLDHLMTLGYVITYAAIVAAECEDLRRLAELLDEAEQVWKRLPDDYLVVVLDALRGWLDVSRGSSEGIERIIPCVAASRVEGETLHLTYCLLLLARARGAADEITEGRAATREGISRSRAWNQRYLEAELWRVDGELAFSSGEAEAADRSLRNAVEIAAEQGADWSTLRALCSRAVRFPNRTTRERIGVLLETLDSDHDLPVFRAARQILRDSG